MGVTHSRWSVPFEAFKIKNLRANIRDSDVLIVHLSRIGLRLDSLGEEPSEELFKR